MPSPPVIGSSKDEARFHKPILPVLEAVAKSEGWVGLLKLHIANETIPMRGRHAKTTRHQSQ
jgi:hypothetical protein